MESTSPFAHSASVDIQNCIKHLTEDDTYNYKNSYQTHKVIENGINSGHKEKSCEYNKGRILNNNPVGVDVNRIEYDDDEKDRKKEKKWTIGGFFRRKCRKDADDSSEESGDGRKGFLSRRKSKRDRRNSRAKTTANGFDIIIPQQKEQASANGIGKTMDELWGSGDAKSANNGPVRYIFRHQPNGLPEAGKPKDTLQVPRHSRRDSNLSRNSSGGSGSLEGRKGRKEVLARAEAKRDQMRDESSSDENESYHSSSSLNRLTADGRRRRHNKRSSKDEEGLVVQNGDIRVVKSDLEGHRLPHNRWIPRGCCPDSSDHENMKFSLINHSATPSPSRSPRARQKQLNHNLPSLALANSYPVSTFPPGIHYPQGRNVPNYNGLFSNPKYIQSKDSQVHNSQPLVSASYRKSNRNSECFQPARRSTSEHSTNRRTLMDYEQFLSSCGSNREKSLSCDQDMHRASYFENDTSDAAAMQFLIPKPHSVGVHAEQFGDGRKLDSSPRDPRRVPAVNGFHDLSQRMLKSYENDRESLTMGNSLPVQHSNYPIVQRSASGNSFSNVYENSNENAYNQIRSSSYQHIPSYVNQQSRMNPERLKTCVQYPQNGIKFQHYRTMTDTVTANPGIVRNDAKENFNYSKEQAQSVIKTESLPKQQPNNSVPNLRYYADQNPRSRNPIHITCNATPSPTHEQPKEPAVLKNQQNSVKEAITNASDFWKLKDQENMMNMHIKKVGIGSPSSKPPLTQMNSRTERSRSGSPKPRDSSKEKTGNEVRTNDEKVIQEDTVKVSRPLADLGAKKIMKAEIQSRLKADSNLDDALNELESIYNSLRLGDEDLTARAERRDLPTYNGQQKSGRSDQFVKGIAYEVYPSHDHQRAVPQRRSGVPDKVNDDMAYRRMNAKDRAENKKFPPHSYLRSSPALSPIMGDSPNNVIQKEPSHEPDVTYDDVVFRNIRHANSTLKIQDPQPPFGIPLGPITPAPNSDYLHATPRERFRPTFTSSKIPDVVKDDLAFRNLRKDNMTANLPVVENSDANKLSSPNYLIQKKRAVRSLSANLYNLIQKENAGYPQIERNNNILEKDCEKTQSLTDLSEKDGKKALEKRLKELKEEKNTKRAEFFELAKEQRKKRSSKSKLSWTELAHLNDDFEGVPQVDTSTETLTEDKENRCIQQRLRVNFNSEEPNAHSQAPETKTYRSPVVELSKYPAAAPSSTLYSNPFREPTPGSPLDEAELEDLLSALEKEAKSASEDLGRQLVELELTSKDEEKHVVPQETKRRSTSVSSEKSEQTAKYSSSEKKKGLRSKSGSVSAVEKEPSPDEGEPVDMLNKLCSAIRSEMPEPRREEEAKSDEDVGKLANEIIEITEDLIRRESKDRKRSSIGFEVVTDLSQILHEMEEHQTTKPQDTFQEVYEYNIGLTEGVAGSDEVDASKEDARDEKESSVEKDIEREFEKLHMEVGATTTKADEDDIVVKELIADVTSSSGTASGSYSPRPFPNGVSSQSVGVRCRDGSSPGSSNGEVSSQFTNDPYGKRDVCDIEEKEKLAKMFNTEAEEKSGTQKVKIVPVTHSSSDSVSHRKEILAKLNSQTETTKPLKEFRRKEDLRGGGGGGSSYGRSRTSEIQVPSSDSHRYISRRDQNKTDARASSDNEALANRTEGGSQQSVFVRETRTSRLRAASRSSISEAGSPRPRKTPDREKSAATPSVASSASNSIGKKEVDKSHKRKSYLNRSHTSEEVCNDIHLSGGSAGTRRRSTKCSDLERRITDEMPTPANKTEVPKFISNGSVGTSTKLTKSVPWNRKSLGCNDRSASLRLANGDRNLFPRKQKPVEEKKCESKLHSSNPRQSEDRCRARHSPESVVKSVDNSPVKRNSKSSPDDFARRADLLAAATLKMINRLDEINKNSRRTQTRNNQHSISWDESSSSSSGDRISFHKAFKTFDSAHKPETKKVPVPEENTAKCCSSSILNHKNSRQKLGTTCSKPTENVKLPKESPKVDSPKAEVASKPSSILKKKVTTDALTSTSENQKQKPVSILKRKCLPQEDKTNFFSGPPVTFSPSVMENENPKRQGILKKRRSLDESEVLRRRNASDSTAEFKPILKNQRRSSFEDLSGRSRFPDYLPQSILKRKSSRDEEAEDLSGSEPQGILKRKSATGHQHVKISDSVILAAAATVGEVQTENIRPILKKKSSSEEHSTPELSLSEPPRPILKKKSSVEVEEEPKKPILKTSRKTSLEDDDGKRCRTFSALEPEHVKPILKRENSRSRLPETEPEVVLRRVKPNRFGRPLSSSDVDDELNAIFTKRRSLEFQFTSAMKLEWELRRAKSVSLSDRVKSDALRRPSSVAEKVNTLENFLHMERERQNSSPRRTPPVPPFSPSKLPPSHVPAEPLPGAAAPKFRIGGAVTRPCEVSPFKHAGNGGRTFFLDGVSSPSTSNCNEEVKISEGSDRDKSSGSSEDENEVCHCKALGPASPVRLSPLGSIREPGTKSANSVLGNDVYHSTDSEVSSNGLSNDQDDSEYVSAVEYCSRKISSLDVKDLDSVNSCPANMEEAKEVAEEIFLLQKSGSVTAKASLFQELEKKFKEAAEEKTNAKVRVGNRGIGRYREKKLLESNAQKYHTQPVSSQDVEEAIRNTRSYSTEKPADVENFEDEPSSMSLSDRVRLFNERIRRESNASPPPPNPAPLRKRGSRFRTQPVTTEEVETAQGANQRISPLAASLMRPPDPDLCGLGALSAQSIKEKIYDHASAVLKANLDLGEEKRNQRRGILKNFGRSLCPSEGGRCLKKHSSESDSSDSEIKSILKSDENPQKVPRMPKSEESLVLKGILKQPSAEKAISSSEESSFSDDGDFLRGKQRSKIHGTNLASILQSVEPIKNNDEKASDGEGSSSGGREVHKFVKNEAVARRRQMSLNKLRNNSSLVKSQSHSAVSSMCRTKANDGHKDRVLNGDPDGIKCKDRGKSGGDGWNGEEDEDGRRYDGLRRSTTQPFRSFDSQADDDLSGATIQERLARLKKSGENDWQKRKTLVANSEDLSVITSGINLFSESCMPRNQRTISPQSPRDADDLRSSILADRLDKLDAAKEDWRKRVQPSDAVQFSVEGKMLGRTEGLSKSPLLHIATNRTPVAERKKRCPKPVPFRSRKQPSLNSVPSSPMNVISNPIARSVSTPGSGQDGLFSLSDVEGPVVSVPKTDDETFTSFFNGLCSDVAFEERLDIKDEDLDVVSKMQSSQLLVQKRNVRIQRRRATVKNPLKILAARKDLQEYTEIKTGIAEKELKRLKIEKASKNSSLAIEALAGLASQEDFTAINLKKASDGGINSPAPPFKSLMLLQIKGRRHVQTRMVEPVAKSINSGDCFILVTPKKLFHYIGEYANVIEKSRSAEISLHIQQNSDLGCATNSVITIGGGGRATSEQAKEFWKLLGDERGRERPAGHPDEDEIFESAIVDTNMIYEVVNDELVPVEAFWGSIPRIEVLDSNKVLVFDFGSEFYLWIGKNVNLPNRKIALKLAKELWEEGYDYVDCDICPLSLDSYFSRTDEGELPDSKKAGPVRPDWALFAKITENMETVLFREKFLDWPDYSRVIRRSKKNDEYGNLDGNGIIETKPCDAKAMLEHVRSEPDLILEGNHLGRGIRYFEEETRRCAEVTTRDVTVWHISEYEYSELPPGSVGHFHMEDSYVVRWHYMITITGRELSGQPSKHLTVGRDRYAYFCWQGRDSPINDKGAAACLTVELDKEHGPQVRISQGFEPPAFLNLFEGGMVVHSGRRDSDSDPGNHRLYIVRGDEDTETVLFEVPASMRQLRSAASFVLVNSERGSIVVWHGLKSPDYARRMALNAAKRIQAEASLEFSFKTKDLKVREEEEGNESTEFVRAVGGDKRQLYFSFLDNKHEEIKTPRLFHLSSVSGEFLFSEISPVSYNKELVSPYPFLQEDLYSAPQPALFMIDTGHCLWLWQGWWEAESGEGDRGSRILRFQAERRAAMTTAMSYWNLKYGDRSPKAYLVWAGLEPLMFTNLFPMWTDRDHVSEINMKEGRKPGEVVLVKTELASLTQSTYPLAQLRSRPLPDGVNPSFLEDYLEPQCFKTLFGMTGEEFYNLPSWKKKKLKQDAGLF